MTDHSNGNGNGVHQTSAHPVYKELHDDESFTELRSRFRRFVLTWTIAFMVWYLLYVLMSNWATDFMSTKLIGNINVALVFGLLQFASTFLIAWWYGHYMNDKVDPLARALEKRYVAATNDQGGSVR